MSIWQLVALLAGAPSTAVVVRWLAGHLTGRAKTRADEVDRANARADKAETARDKALSARDADRDDDDDERDRLRTECSECVLALQLARAEAEMARSELAMARRFLATLMHGSK